MASIIYSQIFILKSLIIHKIKIKQTTLTIQIFFYVTVKTHNASSLIVNAFKTVNFVLKNAVVNHAKIKVILSKDMLLYTLLKHHS